MAKGKQVFVTLKPQAYELLNAYVYRKNLKRTALLRRWIYEKINEEVVKNALVTDSKIPGNRTASKNERI